MKEYAVAYIENEYGPLPIEVKNTRTLILDRIDIRYRKASPKEVQYFLEKKIDFLMNQLNEVKDYLGSDMLEAIKEVEEIVSINELTEFDRRLDQVK